MENELDYLDYLVKQGGVYDMINGAQIIGMNYIFIDKKIMDKRLENLLKTDGYSLLVGTGENARIKIYW